MNGQAYLPPSVLSLLRSLSLCAFFLCSGSAWATVDTLQYFTTNRGLANYVDTNITMQAGRFETKGSCALKEVEVILGGKRNQGGAIVHVYGNEGGNPYPEHQVDLIPPIRIEKRKDGIERIRIPLPQPVVIEGSQFFIAVDNFAAGVTLMTGKNIVAPRCTSTNDYFGWQFIKHRDGQWKTSIYSYAITAIVEYPKSIETFHLSDVTSLVELPDSLKNNTALSWADIDNDSYLDVLVDGQLYRNIGGKKFNNITVESGISGKPKAQCFIDINTDQLMDVIFIGSTDSLQQDGNKIFINQGDNNFREYPINAPSIDNPTSISIADVDNNNYLDLYIGQYSANQPLPSYVMLNNGGLSFSIDTLDSKITAMLLIGSQWEIIGDNKLPYLLAKSTKSNKILALQKNENGKWESIIANAEPYNALFGVGLHIGEDDNLSLDAGQSIIDSNNSIFKVITDNQLKVSYQNYTSGGAWGDINNDGKLDLIITSPCKCRGANIYLQKADGQLQQETHSYGLTNVSAGLDAIWVDFDNDGLLDLSTFVDGRFKLLKNNNEKSGNYLEIDVQGSNIISTVVDAYAKGGKITRTTTSGRGVLVQDPFRLHFGLGSISQIDSIIVNWPNGEKNKYYAVEANRLIKIHQRKVDDNTVNVVSVAPNPSSSKFIFTVIAREETSMNLEIYSASGEKVINSQIKDLKSGSNILEWDGRLNDGSLAPQGVYIYRLSTSQDSQNGKLTITR